MPAIPLPPASNPGTRSASSIPESGVRASPDAFGANVAEANYRGNMQMVGNIASAAQAENNMWNNAIGGVMEIAGKVWQRDQKLEAEANLQELSLGITRETEGIEATGDGSTRTKMLTTFDERANALIDGAQTPYQASIYREGIQRLRFNHEREAVGKEVAAMKQARLDNISKLVEGGEVEVFRNPAMLEDVRQRTIASINEANLTPSQRSKMLEASDQRLHRIAIEKNLISGNIGAAQAMLQNNQTIKALGGLESVRMQAQVTRAAQEANEKAQAAQFQRDLISGKVLADPTNAEHRKMVSEAFEATGGPQQIAAADPNVVVTLVNTAKKTGIIPSSALVTLNGMALNGEPQQKAFALQTVAAISHAQPGILETTGAVKQLRAEADDFHFLTSGTSGLGLDPLTAIQRIEEKRTPQFQEKADARKAALGGTKGLIAKRTEAELSDAFDQSWTWSDPKVGNPRDRDVIMATYRKAFEEHYVRTGDEQMAVAAAQKDMKRTFGVTRLSGDGSMRLMKNPIELRLPAIDGKHDWVKEQALAEIKTLTGKEIKADKLYFENVRGTEEAISRGGVSTGNTPPYNFYWLDDNGFYQTVPGKVFVPDVAAARAKAGLAAAGKRAEAAGLPKPSAAAPASMPNPVKIERENQKRSILDLFGFGARVEATGAE